MVVKNGRWLATGREQSLLHEFESSIPSLTLGFVMFLLYLLTSSLRNQHRGLTLEDLGQLLVELGASYAINMDGGGSSTMVRDLQVINRPTCLDIPLVCQRPVATVMCVFPSTPFGLTAEMLY
jgi:hypothetical protein